MYFSINSRCVTHLRQILWNDSLSSLSRFLSTRAYICIASFLLDKRIARRHATLILTFTLLQANELLNIFIDSIICITQGLFIRKWFLNKRVHLSFFRHLGLLKCIDDWRKETFSIITCLAKSWCYSYIFEFMYICNIISRINININI